MGPANQTQRPFYLCLACPYVRLAVPVTLTLWFRCTLQLFSIVVLIPLELIAAVIVILLMLACFCNLRYEIGRGLSPVLERRRERRRMRSERKRMERAPQVGDVTTELSTAPGEAPSYP